MGKKNIFSDDQISTLIWRINVKRNFLVHINGMSKDEADVVLAGQVMRFAHQGQELRMGGAYETHPQWVADQVDDPAEKQGRFFHDIFEDTNILADHLRRMRFAEAAIVDASLATKPEGIRDNDEDYDYIEYAESLRFYPSVCRLKLDDSSHNMDPLRRASGDKFSPKRQRRFDAYALTIPYYAYIVDLYDRGLDEQARNSTYVDFVMDTNFLETIPEDLRDRLMDRVFNVDFVMDTNFLETIPKDLRDRLMDRVFNDLENYIYAPKTRNNWKVLLDDLSLINKDKVQVQAVGKVSHDRSNCSCCSFDPFFAS